MSTLWNNDYLASLLSRVSRDGGRYSDVLSLLKKGADPDGDYSLHLACRNNHPDIATALLLWGADPGRRTALGSTPLHWACLYNSLACVKVLLDHHSPTDIEDSDGQTPLDIAIKRGHKEVADYVKDRVPSPRGPLSNYPSIKKLSEFQVDSWMRLGRHLDLTEDEMGPIGNTQYPTTYTFLEAKKKNMERLQWKDVVEAFLSIGENELANYICKGHGKGQTVLSVCAYYGWLEFIKSAKEHNPADPVNDSGDTVLAIACTRGNMALIDYLVKDKGWDLDWSVNEAGESLRALAESLQLTEVIKYLDNLNIDPAGTEKQKYMQKLDELVKDTTSTIPLCYLKMFFIGNSEIGKSTTKKRLTGSITNVSSLPQELRKYCSTNLAEFNQALAMVDVDKSKLTLKVSASPEEEIQALFAYVYSSLPLLLDPTPPPAEIAISSEHPPLDRPEATPPTPSTDEPRAAPIVATPQPVSVVKSEQVAVTAVHVDQVIARFRSIVGSGNYAEQLMNKILLNLVDVGGQPGFLEMLPFLSKGPGMFLAFFRLDKDLDELCEVSYEREGDKITPYPAIFTIRETLSQILSAISHHVTLDSAMDQELLSKLGDLASVKPVATLVGTFKDKLETKVKTEALREEISSKFPQLSVSEKEEVVKQALTSEWSGDQPTAQDNTDMMMAANQLLASDGIKQQVQDRLHQELKKKNTAISSVSSNFEDLLFHPDDRQFIALDNFTGGETDIDPLREHLQKIFNSFFKDAKLRIRPTQLLLGVILRKEYDIVSMDDCIHIGRALNMTEEEVRFSVWYLDRFVGALIYHPEIEDEDDWFKKNIICSPQVVFDSISSLIVEPLLELHCPEGRSRDVGFTEAEKRNWKEKGLFSLDSVNRCLSNENQVKLKQGKLIPTDKLVVLLKHSHLLSRVVVKKQGRIRKEIEETRFFIPAILKCASPEELTKPPPPDPDAPSPIKITFKTGYVPTGVFCALISALVTKGGEGILGIKWELVKYGIKRNLVTFHIAEADHLVTLVAHVDCYEIRVIRQDRSISLHDLCSYVLSAVLYVMKEVNENIDPIIAFDCQCDHHQSSSADRLCVLTPGATSVDFVCECSDSTVSLSPHQECWFTKEVALGSSVSLKALPYCKRPDKSLSFEWSKNVSTEGTSNELSLQVCKPEDCEGYYICEIFKNDNPFFSIYCNLGRNREFTVSKEDQLLDDIRQLINEMRSDWYSLSIQLNIDYGTRKAFESDNRFNVDMCFHAVLRHWVRTTSPPLTWTGLVRALRSPAIDRGDVADSIEKAMTSDPTHDHAMTTPHQLPDPDSPLSLDRHLRMVREVSWGVRSSWYPLGMELGVDVETLKMIELGETNRCYTSLLEHWLTRTDPPSTLTALKEALQSPSVGRGDVASSLP